MVVEDFSVSLFGVAHWVDLAVEWSADGYGCFP